MAVEVGSLVVRASFGSGRSSDSEAARLREEVGRMRRELLAEMEEMIAEAERRMRER